MGEPAPKLGHRQGARGAEATNPNERGTSEGNFEDVATYLGAVTSRAAEELGAFWDPAAELDWLDICRIDRATGLLEHVPNCACEIAPNK